MAADQGWGFYIRAGDLTGQLLPRDDVLNNNNLGVVLQWVKSVKYDN